MKSSRRIYLFLSILVIAGYSLITYSLYSDEHNRAMPFCFFKQVTGYACPACGTTRASLLLLEGKNIEAIETNPLVILSTLFLVVAPLWIAFDYITKKQSLATLYWRAEDLLRSKLIAVPLIMLLLLNWYWNIKKGL